MADDFDQLDKAQQKNRLIMEFSLLLAPLEEMVRRDTTPTLYEYRIAFAKFRKANIFKWNDHVDSFGKVGDLSLEPSGLWFPNERIDFDRVLYEKGVDLEAFHQQVKATLMQMKADFFDQIEMVPLDWQSNIYRANSPFTVYLRIQDALAGVRKRVDYFDRYITDAVFQLYLRNMDRSLAITLVITAGKAGGNTGATGVKPLSDLFKQEYPNYRLIQVTRKDMHGRTLRVDDQVFILDVGVQEAGKYPTFFGAVDNQAEANRIIDETIQNGVDIT